MANRERWDRKRPDTKAVVDSIVHGVFVKEGTMVAFPTCFPGTTLPMERDGSHITALDTGTDGLIYGGTSGKRVHLFVGMFHGVTGMVFDMGVVEGATECRSITCASGHFVAGVNGTGGGRIITRRYQPLPFDLIQEWGFERTEFRESGPMANGEAILDLAADPSRKRVFGLSGRSLFLVDVEKGDLTPLSAVAGTGRLAVGTSGAFGASTEGKLWRLDCDSLAVDTGWVDLPSGDWNRGIASCARDPATGLLYLADAGGRIYSLREEERSLEEVARTDLAPVTCMAVTFDGRLFGVCGQGVSRLFQYDPKDCCLEDLGVAVSVIERRRYGYEFAAATVGRDGEVVFGENDDLGHLWLYFPKILPR